MGLDWGSLSYKPSPMVVERATKQLSIERSLALRAVAHTLDNDTQRTRVVLNFLAKEKSGVSRQQAGSKHGQVTTIEPLRGSDTPGDKAFIQ